MKISTHLGLFGTVATALVVAGGNDLGFEGHDLVEPDCDAMGAWFDCRDIDTAPPGVFLGYLYMHHTSETLGPDGNTVYPDTGAPYVTTVTACSSCHFTGGQVPFGTPVYQSPSKYQPDPETGLGPYFTPLGYYRDLEDSIIDCFRNCMNAERAPEKDDPVMVALVEDVPRGDRDRDRRLGRRRLRRDAHHGRPERLGRDRDGDLSGGTTAELRLEGAVPGQVAVLAIGSTFAPTPLFGGTVVPVPASALLVHGADASGVVSIPGLPGGNGPATLFAQFVHFDPSQGFGWAISNALQVEFLP